MSDARQTDGALKVGDERIVDIGPLAHGGHFIAHSDGRTLFVRHALTGEKARVRVTEVARKIVRADAIEILESSEHRVTTPCTWAGPGGCGGCDFQHVDVVEQRRLKGRVLEDSLRRFGRLDDTQLAALDLDVRELPGHGDGLGWRTRMTWARGTDGTLGLHPHRSHDVLPIDRCLIAAAGVAVPQSGPPVRVLHEVRGRQWKVDSDGFWQVHEGLAAALVDTLLEFCTAQPGQEWWDLYSGAGLFAAFLGEAVRAEGAVTAVESHSRAVRAGRRALHDLPQVALVEADVERWLPTAPGRPDGVVLDPPRSGAGARVLTSVAERSPERICYVACDPVALARDAATLAQEGYRLAVVRAFDAFPMTHHFETVALFVTGS